MATTTVPVNRGQQAGLPAAQGQAGFAGALRSEFTKIRSVRSTYWSLVVLVVVTIGIGALASLGADHAAVRRCSPRGPGSRCSLATRRSRCSAA